MKTFRIYFLILMSMMLTLGCGDDNPVNPDGTKPSITSIERNTILPGDEMLIIGKNFGAERGASKVYFDDLITDVYVSWCDSLIKVVVPSITKAGSVKVETTEGMSNSVSYTLDNGPRIQSAGKSRAYIGQDVEILGLNFGSSQGSVYFNGTEVTSIKSWSNTKIDVVVPAGATSGNLTVKSSAGKTSIGFYFTIAEDTDPFINTIFPATTSVGVIIKVSGKNFGDLQGTSYVDFDGIKGTEYSLWTKDSIKVKVPVGTTSGLVRVFVGSQGSNTSQITIISQQPDPIITSLSKTTFMAEETISIIGKNFGSTKADNANVYFNGVAASEYLIWDATLIKVTVPLTATSGKLLVKIGNQTSNAIDYVINNGDQTPQITGINPANAPVNQVVYISGKYFGGTSGGDSYVMFGSVKATEVISWNSIEIGVKVPDMSSGATTVVVHTGGKQSNGWTFTIQSKPIDVVATVEIPAGTFYMGSKSTSNGDAYPEHKVTLTQPLWVGKYEVTQAAYKKVMNQANPSRVQDDNNPVEQLTWFKAIDFCNRLSKLEGLTECYTINGTEVTCNWSANGYRLLTESEWEYACRAGSTGNFGNLKGVEGDISKMGWTANNTQEMKNVGLLQANDFGLYDMHGNAAEWVWDLYEFYDSGDATNPTGPTEGQERCFRGGSYRDGANTSTTIIRQSVNPAQYQYYIGFRVCRRK